MRNYKIAATVRHSNKYISYELDAMHIPDALTMFEVLINRDRNLSMEAISELDITETGESE
jgi:hypothetical protein